MIISNFQSCPRLCDGFYPDGQTGKTETSLTRSITVNKHGDYAAGSTITKTVHVGSFMVVGKGNEGVYLILCICDEKYKQATLKGLDNACV